MPTLDGVTLRAPRLAVPPNASTSLHARVHHAGGKGYRDVLRAFRRDFAHAPDVVLFPERNEDLAEAFELCAREGAAFVPFGGGTSVVSGVSYDGARPVV